MNRFPLCAALAMLILGGVGCAELAQAHGGGAGGAGHGHGAGHGRGKHWGGRRDGSGGRAGSGGGWVRGAYHGWSIPGRGDYITSLPTYCRPVYWEGVAYFYGGGVFYEWDSTVGAYEEVQPPSGLAAVEAPPAVELFVFPENGQSDRRLEWDRVECRRLAVEQSAAAGAARLPAERSCLESRGYLVQ